MAKGLDVVALQLAKMYAKNEAGGVANYLHTFSEEDWVPADGGDSVIEIPLRVHEMRPKSDQLRTIAAALVDGTYTTDAFCARATSATYDRATEMITLHAGDGPYTGDALILG